MEDSAELMEDDCNITASGLNNCSTYEEDAIMDVVVYAKIIVPVTLGLVLIAGVAANVFLLKHLVQRQTRKSPHIILIASLAVSDLSMLLIGMPFVSTIFTFEDWPYGEFICRLSEFAQTLSAAAAVLNLTALSGDRYFVLYAKHLRFSKRHPAVLPVVIWAVSCVFALPDLVSSAILPVGQMEFCVVYTETFGKLYRELHIILKFLFLFILPLITICTFYIMIACNLRIKETITPALVQDELIQDKTPILNRRKRLTIVILSLVVAFVITWSPRYVYLMWHHFHSSEFNETWYIFKIVSFCLMFTNSLFNPIIYGALDSSFRQFVFKSCGCGASYLIEHRDESSESHLEQHMTMTVLSQHHNQPETH